MIKSMTGFGKSEYKVDTRTYIVEIKTLNHKYLDLSMKIPKELTFLEENIRKIIQKNILRGKVELNIIYEDDNKSDSSIKFNDKIISNYAKKLADISRKENIINDISIMQLINLPEAIEEIETPILYDEEIIENELKNAIELALKNLNEFTEKEGQKISEDLLKRIDQVNSNILTISSLSTGLISNYVVKLKGRLDEITKGMTEIDESRLYQEIVIYADKASIEEEITRLKSHIEQFEDILKSDKYLKAGKRLDFIIQEMNREINTIGSKSNLSSITNLVIEVKTELEDIREQVQNIA